MTTVLVLLLVFTCSVLVYVIYFIFKNTSANELINNWMTRVQPLWLVLFLVAFLIVVIYSSSYYSRYFLPEPATVQGKQTVPLFNTTLAITGFIFFLTHILLFYFVFLYRYKKDRKAYHFKNSNRIEILWTTIPAITFIFFFLWGQILWNRMMSKTTEIPIEVEIMGEQFNWWIRYPGNDLKFGKFDFRLINNITNNMGIDFSDPSSKDDVIPVQLHFPKNSSVRLRLRSRDVIHSVFIPHLRVKMDAVPGMPTYLHFTPDVTTEEMRKKLKNPNFNYEVTCAELCGRMHFAMKLIVVIEEQAEFDKWYKSQKSWLSFHPELIKQ